MSVGRNELCPCGSGKKYKKCCGVVTPITELRGRHEQKLRKEYAAWMERLNNFVGTQVSNEAVAEARAQFAREIGLSEEAVLRPEWTAHFFNWYIMDVQVHGETLLESFMKQYGRRMEQDLRRAFFALHLGVYEIVDAEKDVMTVRDLATGETRYVLRAVGVPVRAGQIITGRLLNLGLRDMLFSGSLILQPHFKEQLLNWLSDHPELREAVTQTGKRTYTTDLYRLIVQYKDTSGKPQGEEMLRRIFGSVDVDRVRWEIEAHPAFELKKRDDSREIWVYATRKEEYLFHELNDSLLELHEVLAEVIIRPDGIWLEGFAEPLNEVAELLRLPEPVEQQLIGQLTSTGTKLTKGTLFITSEPQLPPKVLQWAVQTYFAKKWLVTPHDALSGNPPVLVAASDNEELRNRLLTLLEQLEEDGKLGQGLARFMRVDSLRPSLSLANGALHIGNLLKRPLIAGLPDSVYTVHPERLSEISSFVREMTEGKSEATVKKYDEVMNGFRNFVRCAFGPGFDWSQLREEDVAYFLLHDVFSRVDAATKTLAANLLSVLLAFFKWLDKHRQTDLLNRMQPLLHELKETLPEAFRLRTLLKKEAKHNLMAPALSPGQVAEEHLILVKPQADGWLVKRPNGETCLLAMDAEATQALAPDWMIAGLIGQAGDGTWRLYGTPELYPPVVARMLGVEAAALV